MKTITGNLRPRLLLALIVCLCANPALAQWSGDQTANNPICTSTGNQRLPSIRNDGAGGAIMAWQDHRNGYADIYVQRTNRAGVVQWTTNGVLLSMATLAQEYPMLVGDGAGGAIVTWEDNRPGGFNRDIYARRVTASGTVQWPADGLAICVLAGTQGKPQIVSDGSGGAIITWEDGRGTNYDIYAQRVDSLGTVQWTPNGVAVCTAVTAQRRPMIVTDGAGGAIITWYDQRGGDNDVYAQRISSAGVAQWTPNGVAISTETSFQLYPNIVSDGFGGAIIAWQDYRRGSSSDIYAQRIDGAGAAQWTAGGDSVCVAADYQEAPVLAGDGSGGAIIAWSDKRSGTGSDVYAQHLDASGVGLWTADGTPVSTAANDQTTVVMTSDGAGGAVVTWQDRRTDGYYYDIFAQRLDTDGVGQWAANGVAVTTAADSQTLPAILGDGAGGAVIVWDDNRANPTSDIYASRIGADGTLGAPPVVGIPGQNWPGNLELAFRGPNPSGGGSALRFALATATNARLDLYDVRGRLVRALFNESAAAGEHVLGWDGRDAAGRPVPAGVYYARLTARGESRVARLVITR